MERIKIVCPICNKILTPYIASSDLCQKCYRIMLDKYSFYSLKDNVKLPNKNNKSFKIIDLVLNGVSSKDIASQLDCTRVYVRNVRNKYFYRSDVNGNPRPSYVGG